MEVTETVDGYGHRNIRATHETTLEITRESSLTERGDCIIAVDATKGARDLDVRFREVARQEGAKITITVEVGGLKEVIEARGTPRLLLTHSTDLVVRKSDYVCDRTIAVGADKAAGDLSRELVEELKKPCQAVRITLVVEAS